MSRTMQEIAAEMLSTGLSQHQLSLLVELLSASSDIGRQSADAATEARRKRDREYQRKRRQIRETAEANDAATTPKTSSDNLPTSADACNLSSLLPVVGNEEVKGTSEKEDKKKKEKTGGYARGTRLPPDAQLTIGDLDFALALGMTEDQARKAWAEFVDYWIGVPGQRGTKLNWSATWRNRVRAVAGKSGASDGKAGNVVASADKLIARIADFDRPAPGSDAGLRSGENPPNVRLLSKG